MIRIGKTEKYQKKTYMTVDEEMQKKIKKRWMIYNER